MYKGVGVRLADFIYFIITNLTEIKLFHFHRIFENGGGGGALDPPL